MQIIQYQACLIYIWNEKKSCYEVQEKRNVDEDIESFTNRQIKAGLFDWVMREYKPVFIPYIQDKGRESLVIVPMARGNNKIGVITILTTEECTQRHLDLLSMMEQIIFMLFLGLNRYIILSQ